MKNDNLVSQFKRCFWLFTYFSVGRHREDKQRQINGQRKPPLANLLLKWPNVYSPKQQLRVESTTLTSTCVLYLCTCCLPRCPLAGSQNREWIWDLKLEIQKRECGYPNQHLNYQATCLTQPLTLIASQVFNFLWKHEKLQIAKFLNVGSFQNTKTLLVFNSVV